jgi:serine/threonine-protein kinase HipA
MPELEVFHSGKSLGHLIAESSEQWSFVYRADQGETSAAQPARLSLLFPPHRPTILGMRLKAWCSNLLPDAALSQVLTRRLGVSDGNVFSLLQAQGGDCQGAVSFKEPGTAMVQLSERRPLGNDELRNLVAALPARPLLVDVEGARYTLPGARHKIPVLVEGEQIALALGAALSTHILKPNDAELRDGVINEALCMALATQAGIPVAQTTLYRGGTTALIVERVDRIRSSSDTSLVTALHMEDFCQLSGLEPNQKYEREGGVTFLDSAEIIRQYSVSPGLDLRALVQWALFGYLIGYGGGHGKQLALLHLKDGPRLSPFFGLFSTHVYPTLSDRLAMKIGGEDRPDWLIASRWKEFAEQLGIRPKYVLQQLKSLAEKLVACLPIKIEELGQFARASPLVNDVRKLINQRCRQAIVAAQSDQTSGKPRLALSNRADSK